MATEPPFGEERRHDDRLADWRMKELEGNVERLGTQVSEIKEYIRDQFVELRKELFENPVFVTMHLMRMELETRDARIARMERDHSLNIQEIKNSLESREQNSVSSKRFNVTVLIAALGVLAAFVGLFLRG